VTTVPQNLVNPARNRRIIQCLHFEAQRLRKVKRDSHDEVVVVLNDICETLESIDDNVGKMDEWQQDHQRLHDANGEN